MVCNEPWEVEDHYVKSMMDADGSDRVAHADESLNTTNSDTIFLDKTA